MDFGAILILGGIMLLIGQFLLSKQRTFSEHLKDRFRVLEVMSNLYVNTSADHVMLFSTTNDGKKPEYGTRLYVTCTHEVPNKGAKEDFQRIPVDRAYINTLLELKDNSKINLVVEDMDPGLLQRIFLSMGAKYARVFFIYEDELSFFYLIITSTSDKSDLINNVKEDVTAELAVRKIIDIFKKRRK